MGCRNSLYPPIICPHPIDNLWFWTPQTTPDKNAVCWHHSGGTWKHACPEIGKVLVEHSADGGIVFRFGIRHEVWTAVPETIRSRPKFRLRSPSFPPISHGPLTLSQRPPYVNHSFPAHDRPRRSRLDGNSDPLAMPTAPPSVIAREPATYRGSQAMNAPRAQIHH